MKLAFSSPTVNDKDKLPDVIRFKDFKTHQQRHDLMYVEEWHIQGGRIFDDFLFLNNEPNLKQFEFLLSIHGIWSSRSLFFLKKDSMQRVLNLPRK